MNAYPIASLLGCLVHVARHQPHASEHQAAILGALRPLLGTDGLRLEADPESFQINGTEVALGAPGAGLLDEQLLGHGIRHAELAPDCSDGDILRFASVLATFAGTYDSLDGLRAALGTANERIRLTPGASEFEELRTAQWRPRSVYDPVQGGVVLGVPEPSNGDTGEFERFREVTLEEPTGPTAHDDNLPTTGSVPQARLPLEVLLRRGREATVREDWPGLLEVALQIMEAEAEAASELVGSTYRIELRRLLSRGQLSMVARLAHGERRQDVIALLRRFGSDATEVLMELLVEAMNMGERRGYYAALTQMSEGTEAIIQHLDHPQWYVVRNAAELCGDMELAEAVSELARQVKHPDQRVRKAVAGALAKIATPGAIESLKVLLSDPAAAVRMQVVASLSGRRARGMAIPLGELLKKEDDADVLHEALLALGRIGSPECVTILREWSAPGRRLVGRRPVGLRLTAIRALNAIGPAAAEALSALEKDEAPEVRAAASQALAGLRR